MCPCEIWLGEAGGCVFVSGKVLHPQPPKTCGDPDCQPDGRVCTQIFGLLSRFCGCRFSKLWLIGCSTFSPTVFFGSLQFKATSH